MFLPRRERDTVTVSLRAGAEGSEGVRAARHTPCGDAEL